MSNSPYIANVYEKVQNPNACGPQLASNIPLLFPYTGGHFSSTASYDGYECAEFTDELYYLSVNASTKFFAVFPSVVNIHSPNGYACRCTYGNTTSANRLIEFHLPRNTSNFEMSRGNSYKISPTLVYDNGYEKIVFFLVPNFSTGITYRFHFLSDNLIYTYSDCSYNDEYGWYDFDLKTFRQVDSAKYQRFDITQNS